MLNVWSAARDADTLTQFFAGKKSFPPESLVFFPPELLLQPRSFDGFNQILSY
jgi:hypothetical protein